MRDPTDRDILYEFAVEDEHTTEVLTEYIERYPRLWRELTEFWLELQEETVEYDGPLTPEDEVLVERAMERFEAVMRLRNKLN